MTRAGSPVEATPVPSTLANPNGHRQHRRHGQRTSRRFQQARTAEVEFSSIFDVRLLIIPAS